MRCVLLILAALLIAASPTPADREGQVALAIDSEARWVPFTLTPGNQIRFDAVLDGRPVGAILDTGVSQTVLARASAAVAPARLRPDGEATAIGGRVAIEWMPTAELSFGGLTRTGGGVIVTTLPALATGGADAIDLLVGRDLLGDAALDIDYAARRFRLLPTGRIPFRGAIVPLRISPERHVYESELTIGGHRLAPVIVDTGDGAAVTLTRADWARAAPAGVATTSAIAYGLGGAAVSDLGVVPALSLGLLAARDVEVRVEREGGFSAAIGVAGRIGSGLLQRYRVLLDPRAGRMVLSADAAADAPAIRSTSGLLVGVLADRLRVIHVMRGGPGEAGGWRAGDTICAVDGRSIAYDYAASPIARWSVATPGTAVRLHDCTGRERTLTTRAFY
ncbi:MAG TPA: aspartyl protease family protein [Sphingomonas sp.]|jgi:hypothetical protein